MSIQNEKAENGPKKASGVGIRNSLLPFALIELTLQKEVSHRKPQRIAHKGEIMSNFQNISHERAILCRILLITSLTSSSMSILVIYQHFARDNDLELCIDMPFLVSVF